MPEPKFQVGDDVSVFIMEDGTNKIIPKTTILNSKYHGCGSSVKLNPLIHGASRGIIHQSGWWYETTEEKHVFFHEKTLTKLDGDEYASDGEEMLKDLLPQSRYEDEELTFIKKG